MYCHVCYTVRPHTHKKLQSLSQPLIPKFLYLLLVNTTITTSTIFYSPGFSLVALGHTWVSTWLRAQCKLLYMLCWCWSIQWYCTTVYSKSPHNNSQRCSVSEDNSAKNVFLSLYWLHLTSDHVEYLDSTVNHHFLNDFFVRPLENNITYLYYCMLEVLSDAILYITLKCMWDLLLSSLLFHTILSLNRL